MSRREDFLFNLRLAAIKTKWVKRCFSSKVFWQLCQKLVYLISRQFFKPTDTDTLCCQRRHSSPIKLQSPGFPKQSRSCPNNRRSLVAAQKKVIHGRSCFNPFVRFSSLSLSLLAFSTFYAPIVKLILCQRPLGILPSLPSRTTSSNPFSSSSMASLSVDGPAKSLFLWTIVNSRAWLWRTLSLPHKTPSSNILWAALLKIDNASCSKYFIREVSQSSSQQSCQALGAMLQSARTKFFCSDNYQATSCWDLFPVEILRQLQSVSKSQADCYIRELAVRTEF